MKRFIYLILILLMFVDIGAVTYPVSASENGIVSYNQKYGNDTNSADHTPAAHNPNDIHISHGDSSGFEYKVPGSSTTYYADKNSPLYKQLHDNHSSSNSDKPSSIHHHSSSSDEPISSSKMPKLPTSKSKPKRKKTVTITKTTRPNTQNKKLLLTHKIIGAIGVAVVLFGIIYGVVHLIHCHRYNNGRY